MKKTLVTIAIVLGITMGAMAQQSGGGLFQRGMVTDEVYYGAGYGYGYGYNDRDPFGLILPNAHNYNQDQDAAPLGSGLAVLLGLGGAYLVAKRRKED